MDEPTHIATVIFARKGTILPGEAARIARWRRERMEESER